MNNKPCPRCGRGVWGTIRIGDAFAMSCKHCFYTGPICPSPCEAIRAWNTRPIEDALNKRVSELEKENAELKNANEQLRAKVE